jgi:DNA-directed RNA polymerase specialized sigma subunit
MTVDNAGTGAAELAWRAYADEKAGTYATLEQGLKTKELIAAIKKVPKREREIISNFVKLGTQFRKL